MKHIRYGLLLSVFLLWITPQVSFAAGIAGASSSKVTTEVKEIIECKMMLVPDKEKPGEMKKEEVCKVIGHEIKEHHKVIGTGYFTQIGDKIYADDGKTLVDSSQASTLLEIKFSDKVQILPENMKNLSIKPYIPDQITSPEYDASAGWKPDMTGSNKDDYDKYFAEKNALNLKYDNLKVDEKGKLTVEVRADASKNDGLDLNEIKEQNGKGYLKDYLGDMNKELSDLVDGIGKDGTIKKQLHFFSYEVDFDVHYKKMLEEEPPEEEEKIEEKPPEDKIIIDKVVGCPSYLTWTEVSFEDGGKKDGLTQWVPKQRKYRIDFKTEVQMTDAKGNNIKVAGGKSMKSGYGLQVKTKTSYEVKQTAGDKRPYTLKLDVKEPKSAFVTTGWKMTHIYKKQPATTQLQKDKDGWNWKTPVNPLSKNKAAVIYTDRDLKDGKHLIYVEVKNISVAGRFLCTKNTEEFKIKGNMYEDYKVN